MICTAYIYKHLSRSYVIDRDFLQEGRVMRVVSAGVVYRTHYRSVKFITHHTKLHSRNVWQFQ